MSEPCRILFSKMGKARYISHLDLQHTIQRSFIRAGVAMKHTNGFNPHPYMSVAVPLSVGCESMCELMDFELDDNTPFDVIPEKLNSCLPEGITFLSAYHPENKFKLIKWIQISGIWEYDSKVPEPLDLNQFFSAEHIIIEKKTKRGTGEMDIIPAVSNIQFEKHSHGLSVEAFISAQEPSLNPDLLVRAVSVHCPSLAPDAAFFRREEIFFADHTIFR